MRHIRRLSPASIVCGRQVRPSDALAVLTTPDSRHRTAELPIKETGQQATMRKQWQRLTECPDEEQLQSEQRRGFPGVEGRSVLVRMLPPE